MLEISQGKTDGMAEASWAYELPASEIEDWIDLGRKVMENALPPGTFENSTSFN